MKQKTDIERIFRTHYEKMYNLARCILYDEDECKDVVSDVFAKILTEQFVLLPESEEYYLMRSVKNRCLNILSHKTTKEKVVKLLMDENDNMFLESDNELLDRLMQIIDRLEPPIRKLILKLRYLQEMSYQEIADQEGVSKVTVYNHLSQAIDFIRKQLK
jgi:RNA polymerase sigma-70 factor (ECF subfamily)